MQTLTLGSHGDTMVPVPSRCTVDGKPLSELLPADKIEELVVRTRNGGAEVVALLKTGSAYYAPSAAAARMAQGGGRGLRRGHAGLRLGRRRVRHLRRLPRRRGRDRRASGVKQVVETDLTETELAGLREAAEAVRAKQADVADL